MQRLERIESMLEGDPGGVAARPAPAPLRRCVDPEHGSRRGSTGRGGGPWSRRRRSIDLERVKELWPAVVDQLRDSGQELLSSLLEVARPVAVDADEHVVKVGFPPANAFNKRKAEAADARDRFTEAVLSIVGERLRPVFVLLDGDEAEAATAPGMSEDEVFERFKAEFDAEEVVETEPKSETETQPEPKEATG